MKKLFERGFLEVFYKDEFDGDSIIRGWKYIDKAGASIWIDDEPESLKVLSEQQMKERFGQVEGETERFVYWARKEEVEAIKNSTFNIEPIKFDYYSTENLSHPYKVVITIPREQTLSEKVKDLIGVELTEDQIEKLKGVL